MINKLSNLTNSCTYNIGIPGLSIISLILVYLVVLKAKFKSNNFDPLLTETAFGNGWKISHVIFFAFLGYSFPNCFFSAMSAGIAWEFFELIIGNLTPKFFPEFANSVDENWNSWYYASWWDIVMNFFGFIIGRWLRFNHAKIRNKLILVKKVKNTN